MTTTRVRCPLDGCDFTYTVTHAELFDPDTAAPFDTHAALNDPSALDRILAAADRAQHIRDTEDTLAAHYANHRPEDYLSTILRLTEELEAARTMEVNNR